MIGRESCLIYEKDIILIVPGRDSTADLPRFMQRHYWCGLTRLYRPINSCASLFLSLTVTSEASPFHTHHSPRQRVEAVNYRVIPQRLLYPSFLSRKVRTLVARCSSNNYLSFSKHVHAGRTRSLCYRGCRARGGFYSQISVRNMDC
jgi:hypothetical protein